MSIITRPQPSDNITGQHAIITGNAGFLAHTAVNSTDATMGVYDPKGYPLAALASLGVFAVFIRPHGSTDTPANPREGDFILTEALPDLVNNKPTGSFSEDATVLKYIAGEWKDPLIDINSRANTIAGLTDIALVIKDSGIVIYNEATSGYAIGDWVYNLTDSTFYKSLIDNNHISPNTVDAVDLASAWLTGDTVTDFSALVQERYSSLLVSLASVIDTFNKDSGNGSLPTDEFTPASFDAWIANVATHTHPEYDNHEHIEYEIANQIDTNYFGVDTNGKLVLSSTFINTTLPTAIGDFLDNNPAVLQTAINTYVANNPDAFSQIISQYLNNLSACT